MSYPILGSPKPQFVDDTGSTLSQGTLSILEPVDDTNKTYYPTADDADAATNGASGDITLDSRGEPPNALFGVDGEKYKIVLKDSLGATLWTVDNVRVPVFSAASVAVILSNEPTQLDIYPTIQAETDASVTPTNYQYPPGDLRRYGTNTTPGTTDLVTAMQDALDQNNQGGPAVQLPPENVAFSSALSLYPRTMILGHGPVRSTLTYTGTGGSAFVNNTLGVRIQDIVMRDFYLNDTGTGAIGLDLDSISTGQFDNLRINGFTTSVKTYTTGIQATNGALYNRFNNVTAQNATTGFQFDAGSNANIGTNCRTNVCTTGALFADCSESGFITSQFESGTTGVQMTASGISLCVANFIAHCHFETSATEHWNIGSDVSESVILMNNYASGSALDYTDSGLRTNILECRGDKAQWQMVTALLHTSGTPWLYERTTGGTAPMAIFRDSNTVTGSPATVQIQVGRAAGLGIEITDEAGANPVFGVLGDGKIRTNQDAVNTNTPSGATAQQLPIYNEVGTLLGYIPVYGSAW